MADWMPPAEAKIVGTGQQWVPPPEATAAPTPSFMEGVGTGLMDKVYGAGQLASRMPLPPEALVNLPPDFDPASVPKGMDEKVRQREQILEKEGYNKGWGRTVGNIAADIGLTAPLALFGGLEVPAMTWLGRMGQFAGRGAAAGAEGGAIAGATQPVTDPNYATGLAKNVAKTAAGGAIGGAAIGGVGGAIHRAIVGDNPSLVERFIENTYRTAIKPTIAGKGSGSKIEAHDQNILSALSSIVRNKDNLVLTDIGFGGAGKEAIGHAPRTLDQFVQAIAQTKRPVFDLYDGLTKQADALGVKVNTSQIVNDLWQFAFDPSFQITKYDAMRAYAEATAADFERMGAVLPSVAQNMVRNLNEGLTAFYRASSPEAASRAAVDDLVANQLRHSVDSTLEQAGLPGWQQARNEYGALKAIESEVAHRAQIFGRQDPAGGLFGRLGNIATYEELARFATTFDPSALASAMAIRAGKEWTRYYYGPNRAVRQMFAKAEQLYKELGPIEPVPTPVGGMQPARPSGPSQKIYSGPQTPEMGLATRGGSATESMGLVPRIPPGVQPARPSGPAQRIYGGETADPFLMPPGGGRSE